MPTINISEIKSIDKTDLYILLSHYLKMPYHKIITEKITEVDAGFMHMVDERRAGVPVAKIIGSKEFYGLDFITNQYTLDPRPETELMLDYLTQHVNRNENIAMLDLGCGTGCIGITALTLYKESTCDFVDICDKALATTEANCRAHKAQDRAKFIQSDWFDKVPHNKEYDVILCNPPYIRTDYDLDRDTLHDPHLALFGGEDGLACYRKIVPHLRRHCKDIALLEIGYDQGQSVVELVRNSYGGWESVEVRKDYGGHDRLVICKKRQPNTELQPSL